MVQRGHSFDSKERCRVVYLDFDIQPMILNSWCTAMNQFAQYFESTFAFDTALPAYLNSNLYRNFDSDNTHSQGRNHSHYALALMMFYLLEKNLGNIF
jgi:hypothetical protein